MGSRLMLAGCVPAAGVAWLGAWELTGAGIAEEKGLAVHVLSAVAVLVVVAAVVVAGWQERRHYLRRGPARPSRLVHELVRHPAADRTVHKVTTLPERVAS